MGNSHPITTTLEGQVETTSEPESNNTRAILSDLDEEEEWCLTDAASYSGHSTDSWDSEDEEDISYEEDLLERLQILEDAQQLKYLAVAFLHPEIPIKSDPISFARCYYNRFSAPQQQSFEEMKYMQETLKDAKLLKQYATDYASPHINIMTSHPSAYSRCYFSRYSAIEQESVEASEERAVILDDAMKLREAARHYLHPEVKVETSDATIFGRCYFSRYSAIDQESVEASEENQKVIDDALNLKRLAMDYMHPEVRIVSSDLSACARCYFDRISAAPRESYEEAEDRCRVLMDALNLKKLATGKGSTELPKSSLAPKITQNKDQKVSFKSSSAVHLYGLDDDGVDVSYY